MRFKDYLNKGSERSILLKKNIAGSVLVKGADTIVGMLLVPVTLGYLNQYEYGIWLTLYSLLSWINTFDIGLSNGLRNKLAEAIANNDKSKAREYVSTTVVMLIGIALLLVIALSGVVWGLDWYSILNVDNTTVTNLTKIIYFSLCLFCFNFAFKFVGSVYQALQYPVVNSVLSLTGHTLSLIAIWISSKLFSSNLMIVALIYSSAYPLVYLISYPVTFHKLYPYLSPSINFFRKDYIKELLSISLLFFLIQIAGIILFSLTNLIISHNFGPDKVTPYDIAYKYYYIPVMLFNLLIVPVWSAVTDAYTKGELEWIKNINHKLIKVLVAIAFLLLFMTLFSQVVFNLWVGESVDIPFSLCILMSIYIFLIIVSTSYSFLLNGMGMVKLQAINTVIVAVAFYPVCMWCIGLWGIEGILIGMCLCNISGVVLNIIQYYKVVGQRAKGIWTK